MNSSLSPELVKQLKLAYSIAVGAECLSEKCEGGGCLNQLELLLYTLLVDMGEIDITDT